MDKLIAAYAEELATERNVYTSQQMSIRSMEAVLAGNADLVKAIAAEHMQFLRANAHKDNPTNVNKMRLLLLVTVYLRYEEDAKLVAKHLAENPQVVN